MANHFTHKTGCHVYLPHLPDPPSSLARAGRTALKMGQGILVNLLSGRLVPDRMNAHPQTIQIFLPSGDPQGIRVAEITTRIVRVIEVPR